MYNKSLVLKKGIIVVILILVLGTGYFISQQSSNIPSENGTSGLSNELLLPPLEVLATDFEAPWGMDFLPDGTLIVTERRGGINLVDKNGKKSKIFEFDINPDSERGVHGVAVDPNFSENKMIYFHYTYLEGNVPFNRVSRFILENNSLTEEEIVIDKIPAGLNHNGGRIKFGPDGLLYITTGDAEDSNNAQDLTNTAGKILRITKDGNPAPNNPFGDYIYSYGHRNVQGITWDENKNLWATEHGRSGELSGLDELNLIKAGKNYGWPVIQGDETHEEMEIAVLNSGADSTWAPAGAAFLNGSIFFTGLRGSALYEYKIKEKKLIEHFKEDFGRLRNVIVGQDGLLYVATSNRDFRGSVRENDDQILKINPAKLAEL